MNNSIINQMTEGNCVTIENMLKSSMEDLKNITKADFCIMDAEGKEIASTFAKIEIGADVLEGFARSMADSQDVSGYNLLKVRDEAEATYLLLVHAPGMDGHMMGRIASSEIRHLMSALKPHMNEESFYQSILTEKSITPEMYKKAGELNVKTKQARLVYMVELSSDVTETVKELLQNLFSETEDDFVTAVDEKNLFLIKAVAKSEKGEAFDSNARQIVSTLNTELMIKARVTYGTVAKELSEVHRSYKEAKVAMEVAKIFYADRTVADYSSLGIGRLIHQLPQNLCEVFIAEVFGDNKILELEEEELTIIDKFFENNLNVSETARELALHRNTLVYRLEKLQKYIGLDIRKFDDAMTFKIAMMVARYMKYLQS